METTIATTISASNAFFFFISPIPIHARNNFASVDSSPERRVPRTAFGVFHARQGMDALAGGSQGDGARTLFIQICFPHTDCIQDSSFGRRLDRSLLCRPLCVARLSGAFLFVALLLVNGSLALVFFVIAKAALQRRQIGKRCVDACADQLFPPLRPSKLFRAPPLI